jgi:hypothetical protein
MISYTRGVSPNRVRVSAVLCGLLAIAIRLYWVRETGFRQPWLAWYLGSVLVSILVPLGLFYALAWQALTRRGTLRVDAQRGWFVADASPRRSLSGIIVMSAGTYFALFERVPNTDRVRLNTVPGMLPFALVAAGVFLLVGIRIIVVNRPLVILDRDGITLARLLRSNHLPWVELAGGSAQLDPRGRLVHVLTAPDLSGRARTVAMLPTGLLRVDPVLLETAVRTYINEPDRRAEIGTEVGLQHLTAQPSAATAAAS